VEVEVVVEFVLKIVVEVEVVVVVVALVVLVVLVVVPAVVVDVDVSTTGHNFQPCLTIEPSESHLINPMAISASGPVVPEYSAPFTTSVSYLLSVSNVTTRSCTPAPL
jgi:hypothetical protein